MRDIKFRAWCAKEKKMYYKFRIEEHLNLCFMDELIESAKFKYEIMQYTGFKDKNGIEIYEGDIIRIYNDELDEENSWIDEVSWHLGGFFSGDEDLLGNVSFRSKIIGNIYENENEIKKI